MEEIINKQIVENPDSICLGSSAKNAQIKIYGDFAKPDEFMAKILSAKKIRQFAQENLAVNV